ncbi:MAG: Uma2 family endonuclease [Verrucomicrobiales bacterium]|nr:Uma2 family endonuclease [Verrucomicrobiales bacterium]
MAEAALQHDFVSVEDYLAAEEASETRHEYLGGLVYAMSGTTRAHNTILMNLAMLIRPALKAGPCQLYAVDILVNFRIREDEYFYYPDLVVTCDPRDTHPRFVRHPKLIVEVLSGSTRRIDEREKFLAYTTLPSLEEYVLVEQEQPAVRIHRRSRDWCREELADITAILHLDSLSLDVPLAGVYEGVPRGAEDRPSRAGE